jgi:hypothetical protein
MKTAPRAIPNPKISPRCTLSPIAAELALRLLMDNISEFETAVKYSNPFPLPYQSPEVQKSIGKVRGSAWMAVYCGVIDSQMAMAISEAATDAIYAER